MSSHYCSPCWIRVHLYKFTHSFGKLGSRQAVFKAWYSLVVCKTLKVLKPYTDRESINQQEIQHSDECRKPKATWCSGGQVGHVNMHRQKRILPFLIRLISYLWSFTSEDSRQRHHPGKGRTTRSKNRKKPSEKIVGGQRWRAPGLYPYTDTSR